MIHKFFTLIIVFTFWVVTDEPDLTRAAREIVDENGVILYHENIAPGLNGFWVEAKDLQVGDVFLGANGELSTLVNLERVQFDETIKVYNFTVDGNHNYFVIAKCDEFGQTCVLVHNAIYTHTAADDWATKGVHVTVKGIKGSKQGVELSLSAARDGSISISKTFSNTSDKLFNKARKELENKLKSRQTVEDILASALRGKEYVNGLLRSGYKGVNGESVAQINNCIKALEGILKKLK